MSSLGILTFFLLLFIIFASKATVILYINRQKTTSFSPLIVVEVNFSEEFIYIQFVREKMKQWKHKRIYVKNP